ncbi:hypothetical protein MLR82_17055, partial [Escherichia coli]|nr:hypothetical protein [Escherichia coli]
MDGNIKGLVSAGHEMASELKAECGAVDMRSVAKLISDLATQLEVQLVRANALAVENAGLKAAHPQPFGHEMMKALDAYEKHQDEVPETGMLNAFFILRDSIRVDTPATDAFLAEVRAQGVEMYADNLDNAADDAERGGFDYAVKFLRSEASSVRLFAG